MRAEVVDGMDVLKVHDLVKDCADHCRKGLGPVLLEANTYRYRGHSMSDAATYRTKEEVEEERAKNDPIVRHRTLLLKKKVATEAELDAIDGAIKKECDEAVAFADAAPEPPMEELYGDLFVDEQTKDEHPRERVLGATDVKWPQHPTDFKVTWDLEPRDAPAPPTPISKNAKKGAA
jgi:pyruvate dehydrogenase E1 component alpha subunit